MDYFSAESHPIVSNILPTLEERKRISKFFQESLDAGKSVDADAAAEALHIPVLQVRVVLSDLISGVFGKVQGVPGVPGVAAPSDISFTPAPEKNFTADSVEITQLKLKLIESTQETASATAQVAGTLNGGTVEVIDAAVARLRDSVESTTHAAERLKKVKMKAQALVCELPKPPKPEAPTAPVWEQIDFGMEACYMGWSTLGLRSKNDPRSEFYIPLHALRRALDLCPSSETGYTLEFSEE